MVLLIEILLDIAQLDLSTVLSKFKFHDFWKIDSLHIINMIGYKLSIGIIHDTMQ